MLHAAAGVRAATVAACHVSTMRMPPRVVAMAGGTRRALGSTVSRAGALRASLASSAADVGAGIGAGASARAGAGAGADTAWSRPHARAFSDLMDDPIESELAVGDNDDGDMEDEEHFPLPPGVKDEYATSDSEGDPAGPIGDNPLDMPPSILDQLTNPRMIYAEGVEEALVRLEADEEAVDEGEGIFKDRAEVELNATRKRMKETVEDAVPFVDRPLWPLHATIVEMDTVQNVTRAGVVNSSRVLVVVGNHRGGVGFGVGKHEDAQKATKYALRRARRDMIHVATHKGQLYHDLIGKKNSTMVILRAVPPRAGLKCTPALKTIFDYAGIKSVSAKIVGGKRRNWLTVVQAVFDAFQHHTPPEEFARKRGRRIVFMGKNRRNPREVFPFYPRGPRFQPHKASSR